MAGARLAGPGDSSAVTRALGTAPRRDLDRAAVEARRSIGDDHGATREIATDTPTQTAHAAP
jgi:hypothetical protein